MLVTWMTLELAELSEGTIDWLPTGTRAISMVEPEGETYWGRNFVISRIYGFIMTPLPQLWPKVPEMTV